jgi:ubiquinone/menaquinone biosynthesis C-methylase UbiE
MPDTVDPRKDNPSQYFVEDQSNEAEMIRQMVQDNTLTAGMGGPFPEQPDPARLVRVLDVGCGPGGWLLETAALYPHIRELVGIDISWRMIEYARTQAQTRFLGDRVTFQVMNALRPLAFADDTFDLVNMRFGFSFLLVQDWPGLLRKLLRVTRRGGTVRVTDGTIGQSSSPAFNRINQMFLCALYRSGHHPGEQEGMAPQLARLLSTSGCQQVQVQDHALALVAGTVGGKNFSQDMAFAMVTGRPFILKQGCGTEDYDVLYEQALSEMQQPDFHVNWPLVTAWGTKPLPVPSR